jgi:hypothetical protein
MAVWAFPFPNKIVVGSNERHKYREYWILFNKWGYNKNIYNNKFREEENMLPNKPMKV